MWYSVQTAMISTYSKQLSDKPLGVCVLVCVCVCVCESVVVVVCVYVCVYVGCMCILYSVCGVCV